MNKFDLLVSLINFVTTVVEAIMKLHEMNLL